MASSYALKVGAGETARCPVFAYRVTTNSTGDISYFYGAQRWSSADGRQRSWLTVGWSELLGLSN